MVMAMGWTVTILKLNDDAFKYAITMRLALDIYVKIGRCLKHYQYVQP